MIEKLVLIIHLYILTIVVRQEVNLVKRLTKDLQRRARNPLTGKSELIDNVSYKDWYNQNVSQYGQEKIDIAIKKVKNQAEDKEQYDRYINKLGKKIYLFIIDSNRTKSTVLLCYHFRKKKNYNDMVFS